MVPANDDLIFLFLYLVSQMCSYLGMFLPLEITLLKLELYRKSGRRRAIYRK